MSFICELVESSTSIQQQVIAGMYISRKYKLEKTFFAKSIFFAQMQPFLSLEIYNLGKYLGLFYVWKISICINLPKLHFQYIYYMYIFFFCKFVFFFQHCSCFLMSSVKAKLIFRLRSIYFLCTQRKMNYCKKVQ